jgi:hypothetical protein
VSRLILACVMVLGGCENTPAELTCMTACAKASGLIDWMLSAPSAGHCVCRVVTVVPMKPTEGDAKP